MPDPQDQKSDPEAAILSPLIVELLTWVAARPRSYGEAMEAWRTSCPRTPVWEDAVSAKLVRVSPSPGAGMNGAVVSLTRRGRNLLPAAAGPTSSLSGT